MAARFRNEKYYRKLSKKERRQFRLNCEKWDKGRFKYILNSPLINNFDDLISFGFPWSQSLEDFGYWLSISRRFN